MSKIIEDKEKDVKCLKKLGSHEIKQLLRDEHWWATKLLAKDLIIKP